MPEEQHLCVQKWLSSATLEWFWQCYGTNPYKILIPCEWVIDRDICAVLPSRSGGGGRASFLLYSITGGNILREAGLNPLC